MRVRPDNPTLWLFVIAMSLDVTMMGAISNVRVLDMVREKNLMERSLVYADVEVRRCRRRYMDHVLRRPKATIVRRPMFSLPAWKATRGRHKTSWKSSAFNELRSSACAELADIVTYARRWRPKIVEVLKQVITTRNVNLFVRHCFNAYIASIVDANMRASALDVRRVVDEREGKC